MYGLQTTIASDIPFLKTLYAVFIVYYLETKEVEITHLVCLALLKACQTGRTTLGGY